MASFAFTITLISLGLFIGIIAAIEAGRAFGRQEWAHRVKGTGTVEGALFALLGLLIAFTFQGAASRFDARRQLAVDEANNISTAYSRIDLATSEDQPPLRQKFREYVDARIAIYENFEDENVRNVQIAHSDTLRSEIWSLAVSAADTSGHTPTAALLLASLNDVSDIANSRLMATRMHPPVIIFVMLFVLILASALLAGFQMGQAKWQSWLHIIVFAAILSITVYVVLDLEYPRLGLIRMDFDQALIDVRKSMN